MLNKIDVPEARELAEFVRPDLRPARLAGVRDLARPPTRGCRADVRAGRGGRRATAPACRRAEPPGSCCGRPAVDDGGFTVERDPDEPDAFVVRGERPERWIRQTDFANDEAVGYLADRLARLGVEDAAGHGRRRSPAPRSPSATSPSTGSRPLADAVEAGDGPRGTDVRLEDAEPGHRGRAAGRVPDAARRHRLRTRPSRWRTDDVRRRRSPGTAARAAAARAGDERPGRVRRASRLVVKVGSSSLTTAAGGLDPDRLDALVDALGARRAAGTPGRAGVLRGDRGRARAARRCRAARATWPPSRRRRASGQLLLVRAVRGVVRPVRLHGRAGAADRRRPGPPRRTTATPAHAGAAAVVRRGAGGQRERHRRDRGDPVRRQRPAGRAGRAPGRAPTRWSCCPTWTVCTTATRAGRAPGWSGRCAATARPGRRRHRRGRARPASAPAGWRRKLDAARIATGAGHPGAARRGRAGRPRRWPASRSAPRSRPTGAGARRPGCSGCGTPPTPRGRLVLDAGAVDAVVRRRNSLLSAGVTGVRGEFGAGDPVELVGPDGRGGGPRPGRVRRGGAAGAARPVHPRARPRAPARGRTPGRSGPPARVSPAAAP